MITADNRITYQRDDLTEWYVNDERGLEQGFTIHTAPSTSTQNPPPEIVLDLALSGNLTPHLTDAGDGRRIHHSGWCGCTALQRSGRL